MREVAPKLWIGILRKLPAPERAHRREGDVSNNHGSNFLLSFDAS